MIKNCKSSIMIKIQVYINSYVIIHCKFIGNLKFITNFKTGYIFSSFSFIFDALNLQLISNEIQFKQQIVISVSSIYEFTATLSSLALAH